MGRGTQFIVGVVVGEGARVVGGGRGWDISL